jgi:hypothetical protein
VERPTITDKDRADAKACLNCPICKRARKKQRGIAYRFVKTVESGRCPKCAAYERVYGRKAYERLTRA